MSTSVKTALSFVLVGACWGCTTPFIKNGASRKSKTGSEQHGRKDGDDTNQPPLRTLLGPLRGLGSAEAAVPFLINQSGSAIYYYLLGSQDISMAVPVCNALTFVFTAVTAMCLGEKADRPLRKLAGMVLVLCGIAVCVASKTPR